MHRDALVVSASAAALFGLVPFASRIDPVAGALVLLALAVALAFAASGGVNALAAASASAGAFASAVLAPASAAAAGAILVAAAYAERTARVRGRAARLAHVGVALVAGALAGTLASAYAGGTVVLRVVAVVVAAVLASLPLLVDADDPIAHTLDAISALVDEPARASLREGATLRRDADDALLDPPTARIARRTWASLLRLAEARLRLQRARAARPAGPSTADAVLAMVDGRIAEHVAALARAYTAIDTARAAELGLDDTALRSVESVGEALEEVSRAIIDVQP